MTIAGTLAFGVDWPQDWLALAVFVAAGVFCFSALGVALAHVIPNTESAPAYINAVFLPVIVISGVFYEADDAPAVLRDVAQVLPLKHLIDGFSGAMIDGDGLGAHWGALLVLLAWGAIAAIPAVRGFRWSRTR